MCPKGEKEARGKGKRKEEYLGLGFVPIAKPPACNTQAGSSRERSMENLQQILNIYSSILHFNFWTLAPRGRVKEKQEVLLHRAKQSLTLRG